MQGRAREAAPLRWSGGPTRRRDQAPVLLLALRAVGSDGAVSAVRAVVVFAEAPVMTSWRRVGYLSTAQAAGRGFLPAGLFAQVFLKLGGFTTIPVTKFTTAV